ncbi:hypothetical protein EJB05_01877, partial [Eragrostis curvula]
MAQSRLVATIFLLASCCIRAWHGWLGQLPWRAAGSEDHKARAMKIRLHPRRIQRPQGGGRADPASSSTDPATTRQGTRGSGGDKAGAARIRRVLPT